MTIRKIIYLPDPRLRKHCDAVPPETIQSPEIQTLLDDMFETMYEANGVGLAANQIGICKQITVIDVVGDKKQQYVLINPELMETRGEEVMQEGCLSVPGFYDKVKRPTYVKIRAYNRQGEIFELEGEGLLAECMHHEYEHLQGKLYIDRLSPLKKERIKMKLAKALKSARM